MHRFSRTEMLLGSDSLQDINKKRVMVIGIGGVGSHAAEALARTGVGHLTIMDHDVVAITNINRQIHALDNTIGQPKVKVMKERILQINPKAEVVALQEFYSIEKDVQIVNTSYDYIIDAVDNVSAKIDIIHRCIANNIPIISSMGAGNRLNPLTLTIADISETRGCPLARVVRKELRNLGITRGVPVVFSPDIPIEPKFESKEPPPPGKNKIPGSVSFVPAVAGFYLAYYVIQSFLKS
ncbi:MAG: tRNA threonylcarbamoyladenosine dehydratase [Bacillota bacterium]